MGAAILGAITRMAIIMGCLGFCMIASLIIDKIRERRGKNVKRKGTRS